LNVEIQHIKEYLAKYLKNFFIDKIVHNAVKCKSKD